VLQDHEEPHAIMLRSHGLKDEEVGPTVRCVARCGAGTNNVPVARMSERGIPVFNSPGANANAVKELALCSLFLASRGVAQSIRAVDELLAEETDAGVIKKRVEAEKKRFGGQEIKGKTLGVVGLGAIGASLAQAAMQLGMDVVAYDPAISVEQAWKLPGDKITRVLRLEELLVQADYLSLHVPYMPQTHHMLNKDALKCLKPDCNIINFARGELIDTDALVELYDSGSLRGNYIADFPDKKLQGNANVLFMPHLGASTGEAEEVSAAMAADEIRDYLEHGIVRNSVNFPETQLPRREGGASRLTIVNRNTPGVLGKITTLIGEHSVNILQTVNTSRDDVAYNVVDLSSAPADISAMQAQIMAVDGVLSSRFITGQPGKYYEVNEV
jgi:D-3-phosphoglycerate dehydrogenase